MTRALFGGLAATDFLTLLLLTWCSEWRLAKYMIDFYSDFEIVITSRLIYMYGATRLAACVTYNSYILAVAWSSIVLEGLTYARNGQYVMIVFFALYVLMLELSYAVCCKVI